MKKKKKQVQTPRYGPQEPNECSEGKLDNVTAINDV